MAEDRRRSDAVSELETALESDDCAEKNYHVREALQLLELDDDAEQDTEPDEPRAENRS